MKVHEIISLNETIAGAISGAMGSVAKGIERVKNPSKLFKTAESTLKDKVADEIATIASSDNISYAEAAAKYITKHKVDVDTQVARLRTTRDYRDMPEDQLRKVAMDLRGIDPKQLDPAFVNSALGRTQRGALIKAVGMADVSAWRFAGNAVKLGLNGYGFYIGFMEPWNQFSKTMNGYGEQLRAGKLQGGEAQYNFLMNQELTVLLAAWGTQLAAGAFLKGVANKLSPGEKKMGFLLRKENPKFDLVTAAGLQVVRTWLNNGENTSALAGLLLTDILGREQPIAQYIGQLVAPMLSVIRSFTGPSVLGVNVPAASGADAKNDKSTVTPVAQGAGSGTSAAKPASGNAQVDATSPAAPAGQSNGAPITASDYHYRWAADPDIRNWVQDPVHSDRLLDPNSGNDIAKPPGWKPAKK